MNFPESRKELKRLRTISVNLSADDVYSYFIAKGIATVIAEIEGKTVDEVMDVQGRLSKKRVVVKKKKRVVRIKR